MRAQADAAAFAAAWAAGRALPLEQAVAEALAGGTPTPVGPPVAGGQRGALTGRELEVAALAAQGLTNRRIAEALGISERTADTHVAHVLRKLGLTSRAQLRAWAAEQPLAPSLC